jgi:hypothetical protein
MYGLNILEKGIQVIYSSPNPYFILHFVVKKVDK